MKTRHYITALFSIWLLVSGVLAYGQTPPPAQPAPLPAAASTPSMSTAQQIAVDGLPDIVFIRDVLQWISDPTKLMTSANGQPNGVLAAGNHLLMAIAALSFAFLSVKMMLEASSYMDYLGQFINGLIMYGMVEWVLHNYTSGTGGGLVVLFNQGFDQVVNAMLGLQGSAVIANNVWAGFQAMLKIGAIVTDNIPGGANSGAISTIFAAVTGALTPMTVVLDFVLISFLWIVLIADAVLFVAIYIYSMMQFAVGMLVGPIMLPWMLLKPFSFIAEGWIKFMVMAGFYRIVGMAIIQINELIAIGISNAMGVQNNTFNTPIATIPQFTKITLTAYTQWPQHVLISAMALAFAIMTFYMLIKVNEIVQGLLSGGGSGGMSFGKHGLTSVGGGSPGGGGNHGGSPGGGVGSVPPAMANAAMRMASTPSGGPGSGRSASIASAMQAAGKSLGSTTRNVMSSNSVKATTSALSKMGVSGATSTGASSARSVLDAARPTPTKGSS
jgi:type IV secretion system protein TrbL